MAPAGFVRIGRVVRPHALKGEVAVIPTVDLPLISLVGAEVWFVPPPRSVRSARIADVRQGPKGPLVTFEGIDDIHSSEQLRDREMLVREVDLPKIVAAEDVFDPVGLRVADEERGDLGEVLELIITGANDVWLVEGPFGEVLIPVIDDVVIHIDLEERAARVKLLPGLLEEDS